MAELNLKQIIDRLNAEFTGDTRKLVFWYDDKAEFAEDIEGVELENAKVYLLKPDNTFITKRFLEREDTTTNYLIYAPFPKPDVKENHLEDTMLYSKRFFADRASLLSVDLGIQEKYKPIIEKHIKFFASKERTQRFYDLEIENFNEENILVGLLSAICRTRTCSFEEVVRVLITDGTLEDNKFLEEMEKYDLLNSFWKLCEQQFGYTDPKPTLEKLLVTMFVTSTARQLGCDVPQGWKSFVSYKSGNIIAFLDNLMNSVLYSGRFDELSKHVGDGLNVMMSFAGMQPEALTDVDTFIAADQVLVKWIVELQIITALMDLRRSLSSTRNLIIRSIRNIESSITALISWKIPAHLKDFGRWLRTSIPMSSWAKLCLSGTKVYRNLEHSRRFLYSGISIAVMYAMPKNVR